MEVKKGGTITSLGTATRFSTDRRYFRPWQTFTTVAGLLKNITRCAMGRWTKAMCMPKLTVKQAKALKRKIERILLTEVK